MELRDTPQGEVLGERILALHNPELTHKGWAYPALATPGSPATNDAYLIEQDGTVFGIAGAVVGQVILWNGSAWVLENLSQKIIYDSAQKIGQINNDFYTKRGFFYSTITEDFVSNSNFASTYFIPLNDEDELIAYYTTSNTGSGVYNAIFFNSDRERIGQFSQASGVTQLTLNSGNITENTAFVIINTLIANEANWGEPTINGKKALALRVAELEVLNSEYVNEFDLIGDQGYFINEGFWNNSGVFQSNVNTLSTPKLPITQNSIVMTQGSSRIGGTINNVQFWDEEGVYISGLFYASTVVTVRLDSQNIPATARYVGINSLTSTAEKDRIVVFDQKISLKKLKQRTIEHQWWGKIVGTLGDSLIAAGLGNIGWQNVLAEQLGVVNYVRGIGSSSITGTFSGVNALAAVEPDGTYITRRALYANDEDYQAAIVTAGFTNEVTSPTWIDYSDDPDSYSLPANSWFEIAMQGSSRDRINTLPLDCEVIIFMFGTNDEKNASYLGDIDDITDGEGGLTKNFTGSYRQALLHIKDRFPNIPVILLVPPKANFEYNFVTNVRTADGITFDSYRERIREIGRTFGYPVIDTSLIFNFTVNEDLTDGIHPKDVDAYRMMGEFIVRQLVTIALPKMVI